MKRFFLVLSLCIVAPASAADLGTEAQKAAGKVLYDKHCAQCHGVNGDAKAPAAPYYKPRPRDFTSGKYKVRTTLNGELPTDQDIKNAIIKGLAFGDKEVGAYTVMPPWPKFSDEQVSNLTYYLKSFSSDFADPEYNNPKTVEIPEPPAFTEESAKNGRTMFENNECIKCHGVYGRGDGASAPTLKDDWGHHIRAADLTKRWTFRGGGSRKDIFRTISTGFNGTPMPSYRDALSDADRWDLTNYVYSLSTSDKPNYSKPDKPIVVQPTEAAIDLSDINAAMELFASAEVGNIAISGQVVEPGREFFPSATEVQVKAIYNKEEIAIQVQWHDMNDDVGGTNAPDAEVPMFDPEAAMATEAGASADDEDPFADEEEAEEEDPFAEEEEDPFAEEEGEAGADAGGAPVSKYSDAVAVQLPSTATDGFKKPYFVFGDSNLSVDLWFLDLAKSEPQLYLGKGSDSLTPKDSSLASVAQYKEGVWTAILKRPRVVEGSTPFEENTFVPVAFSVWDGFNEERGNKRGLTSWYNFYLEPMKKESAIGPMLGYGGGLLLLELLLIGYVRKKNRDGTEVDVRFIRS